MIIFTDYIVTCGKSKEQVKESLERWQYALERRRMNVSISKIPTVHDFYWKAWTVHRRGDVESAGRVG